MVLRIPRRPDAGLRWNAYEISTVDLEIEGEFNVSESNPYLRRKRNRCTGTQAEKRTAKRLKATLTPASGALDGAKGDMSLGLWLLENKSTVNFSVSLKLDWLLKISQEALEKGKYPALCIQFTHQSGLPRNGGSWVLMPESVFKELQSEVDSSEELERTIKMMESDISE